MTVQEVIDMAKYGELRNLKLGEFEDKAIVSYLNLGLIELYKRFPLSIKEVVLELNTVPNNEYLLPNDCMWLISAYGEVPADQSQYTTMELDINNEDNPMSINTVSWNKVQIPVSIAGAYVSLIYDDAGMYLLDDVQIPVQLVEPLLFYVGYRAHGAMDGSIQADSNTHYMRFDASCKRVKNDGMMTNDNLDMRYRVRERGFM
jgi:hypothetical protein